MEIRPNVSPMDIRYQRLDSGSPTSTPTETKEAAVEQKGGSDESSNIGYPLEPPNADKEREQIVGGDHVEHGKEEIDPTESAAKPSVSKGRKRSRSRKKT
jgi:hypothetical protein